MRLEACPPAFPPLAHPVPAAQLASSDRQVTGTATLWSQAGAVPETAAD